MITLPISLVSAGGKFIGKEVAKEVGEELGEKAVKEVAGETAEKVIKEMTEKTTEKMSKEAVKDTVDGVAEVTKKAGNSIEKINPLRDPKIAKDVIEDPNAVYGYKPKPGSSLDQFDIDWSNVDEVAKARAARLEYLKAMDIKKAKLEAEVNGYLNNGKNMKEIAEIKVEQRNRDRIKSYTERGDYESLEKLYNRNMKEYGQKEGPTAEQLFEKYGSYEEVIYSSVKVNQGMNMILGIK